MKQIHPLKIIAVLFIIGGSSMLNSRPLSWKAEGRIPIRDKHVTLNACSANGISYIANETSLLSSRDNGSTWAREAFPVETVTTVFCGSDLLIAGNIADLRISRDGGLTWLATTGINVPEWSMDPVFSQCKGMTFVGISQIGDMIDRPDWGVLYRLENQTWVPHTNWNHDPVYRLHCSVYGLFLGDGKNIEIIGMDDSPKWQVTLNDGLRVPCSDYRYGCDIGRSEPFLSTAHGIYLFTGWGVFRFRKNLTGWDQIHEPISDSFYPRSVIRCRNQVFLTGKNLLQVEFETASNLKITQIDSPPGSVLNYWASDQFLFSINDVGEVFRHSCN